MAPKTDVSGRIQQPQNGAPAAPQSLGALLMSKGMMGQIKMALPAHLTAERMTRILVTALRTTKNLAACDQTSFMGCVLQASQLGLEVNTALGHCYLIPRRNKTGGYDCTMIIGYQGMIDLAMRSGKVSSIKATAVRKGDAFEHEEGLNPILRFKPAEDAERMTRPITHVFAVARIRNGDPIFVVLSRAEIDDHMRRSETVNSNYSPWKSDYEAMACKTGVRVLFKWIPKSPEMAAVVQLEQAAERGEKQAFDAVVADAIDTMGFSVDVAQGDDLPVPDNVDPDTGETIGAHVPGQPS